MHTKTRQALGMGLLTTIATLAIGSGPQLAQADSAHELPQNLCWEGCTPSQEKIAKAFEAAGPLQPATLPSVYSGNCYHRSPEHDGNQAHHAVAYFHRPNENAANVIYYAGQFSFHAKSNPYESWQPADAERELKPKTTENALVHFEQDYAWLDYNPGKIPVWQYYLRQSGSTVYLIGFWGTQSTAFCELPANAVR